MKYTSSLGFNMSGSQNGVTASHNRYGPYLRTRAIPTNPNTSSQQTARANLTNASIAWRSLTDAQRETWSNAASGTPFVDSLGQTYYLTGHQFYCRLDSFVYPVSLTHQGGSSENLGKAISPNLNPASITLDATVPGLTTTATAWTDLSISAGANDILALWISPPQSPGVTYYKGPWKRFLTPSVGYVNGLLAVNDPIVSTGPTIVAGLSYFIAARQFLAEDQTLSDFVSSGPFVAFA